MKCEVGSDDGTGKFDTARNFDVTFPLTPALSLGERENHSRRLSQSNSALIQNCCGSGDPRSEGSLGKNPQRQGIFVSLRYQSCAKIPG